MVKAEKKVCDALGQKSWKTTALDEDSEYNCTMQKKSNLAKSQSV